MELEIARWLVSAAALPALAAAASEADPDSLAAGQRLRRQFPSAQAAAALTQVGLRRKAVAKFGTRAEKLFFTAAGLEQATRDEVARWRAERFVAAGANRVADLGCGLGADALAFADAGLEVVAVEADPVTAVLAGANLGSEVINAPAEQVVADLDESTAVFVDPARRNSRGRTWRVSELSPSWEFATSLLAGRFGCVKAAPGLAPNYLPESAGVTWVSHGGDLVETSLWSSGGRAAVLLPGNLSLAAGDRRAVGIGGIGRYLYEPDPAVIRSGAIATLAAQLGAHSPAAGIAYLFADEFAHTRFATGFEVIEVLAFGERELRGWAREHGVGALEIKVRGIELDPAVLRRRLKLKGPTAATVVLSPTPDGAKAIVVRRLGSADSAPASDR